MRIRNTGEVYANEVKARCAMARRVDENYGPCCCDIVSMGKMDQEGPSCSAHKSCTLGVLQSINLQPGDLG